MIRDIHRTGGATPVRHGCVTTGRRWRPPAGAGGEFSRLSLACCIGVVATPAPPAPFDIAAAAVYLSTSERHVRRLVAEGRIGYQKVGKFVRFSLADLDEFLATGRVEPFARVAPGHHRRPPSGPTRGEGPR